MLKPQTRPLKSERFNMFVSKEEMQHVEDWRFANRIGSLSEAVRRLVRLGLAAHAAATQEKGPAEVAASPSHGSHPSPGEEQ